jgi:nucleoside-diphosphate-sugar epimerase
MSDSVLVTGASSQLGMFALPRLQAAGFRVLALSRRAPPSAIDVSEQVSWQNPGPVPGEGSSGKVLPGWPAQHLLSCGPLDLAIALLIKQAGLRRVVAFSTSSILTKAGSANQAESEHMAEIQEQELRLKKLCDDRDVSLVLLRPTLIYGCGLDHNISTLARFGRRFGFIPLAGEARGLRQPVHADDLAAVAVHALSIDHAPSLESVACGGSTLSYRQMTEKIAAACGAGVRTLTLPPWLLAAAVRAATLLPAFRTINAEMVRRQGRDMVFDDTALREALDYQPRPFEPTQADFKVPEAALELQLPAKCEF